MFFPYVLLCVVHKRNLRGSERNNVSMQSEYREAAAVHREKLAAMTPSELIAGNITACQTPATIRQAVYERRKKNCLAGEIIDELK